MFARSFFLFLIPPLCLSFAPWCRLRNSNPQLFTSLGLYLHACSLMEDLSFRLSSRQFVHGLFARADLTDAAWAEVEAVAPEFDLPAPAPDLLGQRRTSPSVKALRKSYVARRGYTPWQ